MLAMAASWLYDASPYCENALSLSVGSWMTGGLPVILAFPVLLMLSPTCMRTPALVESLDGQPAQPVGTLSAPAILTLPATKFVPPEVTAAWMLSASGRMRVIRPIR